MELPELEPVAFDFAKGKNKTKYTGVDEFIKVSAYLIILHVVKEIKQFSKTLFHFAIPLINITW